MSAVSRGRVGCRPHWAKEQRKLPRHQDVLTGALDQTCGTRSAAPKKPAEPTPQSRQTARDPAPRYARAGLSSAFGSRGSNPQPIFLDTATCIGRAPRRSLPRPFACAPQSGVRTKHPLWVAVALEAFVTGQLGSPRRSSGKRGRRRLTSKEPAGIRLFRFAETRGGHVADAPAGGVWATCWRAPGRSSSSDVPICGSLSAAPHQRSTGTRRLAEVVVFLGKWAASA